MPNTLTSYIQGMRRQYLDELIELLRIPSISTLPEHRPDMKRAAEWMAGSLSKAGLENVKLIPTEGNDLVYAEWMHAPGAPTVLSYGHYDVQPADPLGEWTTPPFAPEVRGENLYARGATDNKGQIFTHIKAAEALLKTQGRLPVNLRFLIEGEEEVGSRSISKYMAEHAAELPSDAVLVSDSSMFKAGAPSMDIGVRGMVYMEIELQGAATDLHSGLYGGVAPNPLEAMARLLSSLKDESGHILIPGFYDDVRPPDADEKASWARLPFDENEWRECNVKAPVLTGEPEYGVLERVWTRPTLEIHGMPGGFTGPGAKTVIPARAAAKLSARLVPDQKPEIVAQLIERALRERTPKAYQFQCRLLNTAEPVVFPPGGRFNRAGAQAIEKVYGKPPGYVRCGGSIPIVPLFARQLHAPVVMIGLGLPDDGLHGPNEKFSLENFYRGIEVIAEFLQFAARA